MYDFIKRTCEEIGPRSSATSKEHEGLKFIEKELKSFSDETFQDDFECHPGAYPKGNVYLGLTFFLIGHIGYFIQPIITLIFVALGLLSIFAELFLMKEAVDFLFPKKSSWNVFGKVKPIKETRKIVIMGGHSDSAYLFPWYPKFRNKIVRLTYSGVAGIAILPILAIIKLINVGFSFFSWTFLDWFYFIALGGSLWGYYVLLGYFTGEVVDGANDNLSGVAVSLAVGKYLAQHRPKYVETWVGAFGCEECGQRGSKAFVKAHAQELQNSYTLIPESIGSGDFIAIIKRESMCFTDHSKPLVEEIEKVAKSLLIGAIFKGKKFTPAVSGNQPYADTDAMRFSEKGFEATAFLGLNKEDHFPEVWHEKADTYTCINKQIIGDAAEIILQFIINLDKELAKES